MNKSILIIIVILVIAVGGYFLFVGNSDENLEPASDLGAILEVPAPGETDVEETVVNGGVDGEPTEEEQTVQEITIVGTEFAFSPAAITVEEGQSVKITFENQGEFPHNLVIEELGITTATISGGQTDAIEFIAPSAGTYTTFCSVGTHRELGMEGNLDVRPTE